MKHFQRKRTWVLISAVLLLSTAGGFLRFRNRDQTVQPQQFVTETHKRNLSADVPQELRRREDVGWVFGRLVGIPGADRPLMPQRNVGPVR
ncbi:MAG: hypothetical protein KDA96_01710 [Planctomycetaceae bacterium]|nr:hypothetical protein [Planctomycetaceae bacterium]